MSKIQSWTIIYKQRNKAARNFNHFFSSVDYEFIFTVTIICVIAFIVLLLLVLMCLSCWVWSVQRENKQLKEHSRREVSMICTASE